ncbi:MAG: N-acetyltransferase family protein [Candidatus Heimdallarchaeaceae archaeon]|jgi:ribosomal protein S18 acetylase RimI-like enzyme
MKINIRELAKKDFNWIKTIFDESFSYHEQIDPNFASIEDADQVWINYISTIYQQDNFKVYVAQNDDKIVGYCVGQIVEKPPVYKFRKIGQINNIAVKEGHKQRGIGQSLFEQMKEWFVVKNVSHIELSAATNNPQSLAFWNKMGGREFMKSIVIQL